MRLSRAPLIVLLAALGLGGGAVGIGAASPAAAACRSMAEMAAVFTDTYPTGGVVARFEGAAAVEAAGRLLRGGQPAAVQFLYSGDGPKTGRRGRYLFVLLDSADCPTEQGWINGDAFDRVTDGLK